MKIQIWKKEILLKKGWNLISREKNFNNIKNLFSRNYKKEFKIINNYFDNLYDEIWKFLPSSTKFKYSKNELWRVRNKIENLRENIYYWIIKIVWIENLYNAFNDKRSFVKPIK